MAQHIYIEKSVLKGKKMVKFSVPIMFSISSVFVCIIKSLIKAGIEPVPCVSL